MTYPDPYRDRPRLRLPRLSSGTWLAVALVAGAAPWAATMLTLLWP